MIYWIQKKRKWIQEQNRARYSISISKCKNTFSQDISGSQCPHCNPSQTVKSCLRDYLNFCLRVCQQSDLGVIRLTVVHKPVQSVNLVFCCVPNLSLLFCYHPTLGICSVFWTYRACCQTWLFIHMINVLVLFGLLAQEQLLSYWLKVTCFYLSFFPPSLTLKPLVNGSQVVRFTFALVWNPVHFWSNLLKGLGQIATQSLHNDPKHIITQ